MQRYVLASCFASLAILCLLLLLGHIRGKFDLWGLPIDARTKRIAWRLVAEIMIFPVAVTCTILLALSGGDAAVWALFALISVYSGVSVLKYYAQARAGAMYPRQPMPTRGPLRPPERYGRGSVDGPD